MNETAFLLVGREALLLMVIASAPPLLSSLLVGALISVLQAITSIQEASLTAVPKLIVAILSLVVAGPWIGAQLARFTTEVMRLLPAVAQ